MSKPFHESVIDAINECTVKESLKTLVELIIHTEIPHGANWKIIESLRSNNLYDTDMRADYNGRLRNK